MAKNVTTSYDLAVNHEVKFRCGEHKVDLDGRPTWYDPKSDNTSLDFWMIDTSEMWCIVGQPEDDGLLHYTECTDSWVITITAAEVAS